MFFLFFYQIKYINDNNFNYAHINMTPFNDIKLGLMATANLHYTQLCTRLMLTGFHMQWSLCMRMWGVIIASGGICSLLSSVEVKCVCVCECAEPSCRPFEQVSQCVVGRGHGCWGGGRRTTARRSSVTALKINSFSEVSRAQSLPAFAHTCFCLQREIRVQFVEETGWM